MPNIHVTKDDLHKFAHNVNVDLLNTEGIEYLGREWVFFKNIKNTVDHTDNTTRIQGEERTQVEALVLSFDQGIDFNANLPILELLPTPIITKEGSIITHRVIGGNHRIAGLTILGYEGYWFDIVKTGVDGVSQSKARKILALRDNNPRPQLLASENDIVMTITRAVNDGDIANDEKEIREFAKLCCPYHSNYRIGVITAMVCATTSPETNFVNWNAKTKDDLKVIMKKTFKRASHGEYDDKRNLYGYTFLDGYVLKGAYHALKKYHETGKESYVIGHVKSPDSEGTLVSKRLSLMNSISDYEDVFKSALKFYQKNGRLPFKLEGFLPQDAMNEIDSLNKGEILVFTKQELEAMHKLNQANKLSNTLNITSAFDTLFSEEEENASDAA